VKYGQIETLKSLALAGALKGHIDITSSELGELMGTSQQTASNRILELVDLGVITREMRLRRQRVRITEQGMAVLRKEYLDYRKVFDSYDQLTITGELTGGSGEGSYYLQQDEYREQFERILGSKPFEGTLNLKVRGREAEKLSLLKSMEGILVRGFQSGRRAFGDVKCFLATIHNKKCAVVIPLRSHHSEIVEVISELKLRDAFHMQDGDLVAVDIDLASEVR
jgi:riboflavin kinase